MHLPLILCEKLRGNHDNQNLYNFDCFMGTFASLRNLGKILVKYYAVKNRPFRWIFRGILKIQTIFQSNKNWRFQFSRVIEQVIWHMEHIKMRFKILILSDIRIIGAAREGTQGTFAPKLKKLLQKNDVISECSIFSKFSKNSIFLMNFYKKISKFSQNCPTICICPPNARKINAGILNFVENRLK